MTISPMSVFLVASLTVHSLVLLQTVQTPVPAYANTGSPTLKISIAQASIEPRTRVQTRHKPVTINKQQVFTAKAIRKTTRADKHEPPAQTPADNKPAKQVHKIATAHRSDLPSVKEPQMNSPSRRMPGSRAPNTPDPDMHRDDDKGVDQNLLNTRLARDIIGNALQQRLNAAFKYPWLARKRGWQGNVLLSLRIEQNGHLSNIQVSKTSGYSVLDNSALESAHTIKNLPEAVELLQGKTLILQIPVQYILLDS